MHCALTLDAGKLWLDLKIDRKKGFFFHLAMMKVLTDTMSLVLLSFYQIHTFVCEYSKIFVRSTQFQHRSWKVTIVGMLFQMAYKNCLQIHYGERVKNIAISWDRVVRMLLLTLPWDDILSNIHTLRIWISENCIYHHRMPAGKRYETTL